jgi:hypothetical protein
MPEDEPSRADSEHTQVAERATLLDEDQPNSSAVQEGAMAKHKAPSAQTLALVLLPLLALLVVVVQLGGPTETLQVRVGLAPLPWRPTRLHQPPPPATSPSPVETLTRPAQRVQGLVADGGTAGPFIFAAAYVVATVALLPAAILTLAAGYLYGPLAGTALVSVCSTTACAVAFLISRYLVCTRRERLKESGAGGLTREVGTPLPSVERVELVDSLSLTLTLTRRSQAKARVERLVETMPRVAALQDAIASEGGRVVLLLRLSPLIPFALSNYFFGAPAKLSEFQSRRLRRARV